METPVATQVSALAEDDAHREDDVDYEDEDNNHLWACADDQLRLPEVTCCKPEHEY